MKAPDGIQILADELAFRILGWDEVKGSIVGNGYAFVGGHAEIGAYLEAWAACKRLVTVSAAKDLEASEPAVPRSIVVLRSGTPIAGFAMITVRPWRPFRGERIAIPDAIAPYFEIEDVKVGNCSQFERAGSQSAMFYAARIDCSAKFIVTAHAATPIAISIANDAIAEFGRALSMATCQVAQDIVMCVQLKKGAPPTEFEAMILGHSIGSW
jgi:hypothetical protein